MGSLQSFRPLHGAISISDDLTVATGSLKLVRSTLLHSAVQVVCSCCCGGHDVACARAFGVFVLRDPATRCLLAAIAFAENTKSISTRLVPSGFLHISGTLSLSESARNTARLALDDKCSARPVARNPLHRLTCDVQRSFYLETMLRSGHPTACPVTHSGRLTALAHSLQCRGMPCCCIASHIVVSAIAELLRCLCSQVACRTSMAPATNSRLLEANQSNAKQSSAKQSSASSASKAEQCKP